MRVLVGVSGWQSHYFTVAPLAWAFRLAGHDVLVISQPSLTDVIRRSGMPAKPVGPDVDLVGIRRRSLSFQSTSTDGDQQNMAEIAALWREATQSNLAEVVAFARQWRPDLIVADPMCPAGLVAAHLLGVPGIRYQLAPDPVVGSRDGEALLGHLPGFYEPFERYGLRVSGDPAAFTVDPCPPSLLPPPAANRIHMRYVPYNGPFGPPAGLPPRSGRPRICVTWGTTLARTFEAGFVAPQNDIIASVSSLDAEVVLVIDAYQRPMIGEVGPNVIVVSDAALHMVTAVCDLIVHQGGAGSVLTAARYGVRQLAVSYLPDQAHVATVLAATGAGVHLPGEGTGAAEIRDAAQALLTDPSYSDAAQRLRAEMASQPGPAEIAALLAGHARGTAEHQPHAAATN